MKKTAFTKAAAGFLILFVIYHTAEYMMLFRNSAAGLIFFQLVFFAAARGIAQWLTGQGFAAWGLAISKERMKQLAAGLLAGFAVYSLYFITCLSLGIEYIEKRPPFAAAAWQFLYLGFGTALTSLSEDIFTRAFLYRFLNGKIQRRWLIAVSAAVYTANHIYRLQDGWQVWAYLFITGLFLMTAYVNTGNIWMTFGLHWSGNMVYHCSSNILTTGNGVNHAAGIYLYIFFLLLLIPLTIILSRKRNAFILRQAAVIPIRGKLLKKYYDK